MTEARPPRAAAAERGRWSSRRKQEVVLRVLRGQDSMPLAASSE
jgi:hypothetical protein